MVGRPNPLRQILASALIALPSWGGVPVLVEKEIHRWSPNAIWLIPRFIRPDGSRATFTVTSASFFRDRRAALGWTQEFAHHFLAAERMTDPRLPYKVFNVAEYAGQGQSQAYQYFAEFELTVNLAKRPVVEVDVRRAKAALVILLGNTRLQPTRLMTATEVKEFLTALGDTPAVRGRFSELMGVPRYLGRTAHWKENGISFRHLWRLDQAMQQMLVEFGRHP